MATPASPALAKTPAAPAQPASPATQPAAAGPALTHTGFWMVLIVALLALGALFYFFAIVPRLADAHALDREQKISTQRVVIYAVARSAAPKTELPLPGTMEAFQQASIFARTTGYVKKWNVDIGDHVKEGDILAELDTPDVDQQLSQAQATAEQAQASLAIAQTAASRWDTMVKDHAVSQEEADEKDATRNEAQATFDADEANVRRLTDLENFKEIRAPFTGTITYRNIQVGNLVTAGTGTVATGTTELYRIAQTDPLRVYVDVPEADQRAIKPGVGADLHVSSYPDRVFHGSVVRSAESLDITSRTLRTEIDVPNPDGALLPGAYTDVRLQLVDPTPAVLIPANTLVVNASGTQVALIENVDGQDKVHFLPVKVGRDFGTEVEILQNVREGDRLITNPPADMNDGAVVIAKPLPPKPTPTPANTAQKA